MPGICKKETPDYLILWVLAHGGVNTDDNLEYVLTKDSDKILVNTILERLSGTKLPQMDGKPKVVIILACRYYYYIAYIRPILILSLNAVLKSIRKVGYCKRCIVRA